MFAESEDRHGMLDTSRPSTELLRVLDKFPECFSDKPGLCELVSHEINVTPEFKPMQFKAYRVPEILKGEIDWQIDELLKKGFIKQYKSPIARPIVCVLKKTSQYV